MLRFLALTAFALLIAIPAQAAEPVISGPIRVIDADTFHVGTTRIRLHAIDAPELDQGCETEAGREWADCGAWVSEVVRRGFDGLNATCRPLEKDRYGRTVARCFVGGQDVGAMLVENGLAFAYVKYGTDYVRHQARAEAAKAGMHRVRVTRPDVHRAARTKSKRPVTSTGRCDIKGNISDKGRIYHVPGQEFYSRTRINTRKGERWFCSPREAEAAGWRAARR